MAQPIDVATDVAHERRAMGMSPGNRRALRCFFLVKVPRLPAEEDDGQN
jgi:hypothetical protein